MLTPLVSLSQPHHIAIIAKLASFILRQRPPGVLICTSFQQTTQPQAKNARTPTTQHPLWFFILLSRLKSEIIDISIRYLQLVDFNAVFDNDTTDKSNA